MQGYQCAKVESALKISFSAIFTGESPTHSRNAQLKPSMISSGRYPILKVWPQRCSALKNPLPYMPYTTSNYSLLASWAVMR